MWSAFAEERAYFSPSRAPFMINYRVTDLGAMLAQLRAAGVAVDERTEESEFGRFGWGLGPGGQPFRAMAATRREVRQGNMAALVIVDIEILDPARYEEYKKLAAPTVVAHGGRYVVRGGKLETLEGAWRPGRLVVLEFPSWERAKEWWESDAYRPARALRHASANSEMILVESV